MLQAILSEVERATPTDFDSVDTARTWLAKAGTIHSFGEAADEADPHGLLPLNGSFQGRDFKKRRPKSSLKYFLDHTNEAG